VTEGDLYLTLFKLSLRASTKELRGRRVSKQFRFINMINISFVKTSLCRSSFTYVANKLPLRRSIHVPTINSKRLNDTLHSTCEWGAAHPWGSLATETGMARLALNDDDAKVRRWFIEETKALGCKITIDQMGNIFAVLPGRFEGHPTAIGSHLDTQPMGGRYDGILGVMAGLEAFRTIVENKVTTNYPIALIDWTKYLFYQLELYT
jgi:hypothetical protein